MQALNSCEFCYHDFIPECFGSEAPWWYLVAEAEFASRVELTEDQCVVDGKTFFIRGHIAIPIRDWAGPPSFSVWSSLSERSFCHVTDRWEDEDRDTDPPYFGWLSSEIPIYPSTIHLKLSVQSRQPGLTPLFTVEPTDHPLAVDQREGITIGRWHEIVHQLMH